MRLNKLSLCTLALLSLFFLFCGDRERSDIITGAGGDVIKQMDPTLTDMENGFNIITLGAEETEQGFSIPEQASANFSTQAASSRFMVGINGGLDDTLRAGIQFRALNGTSRYNRDDELDSVSLYFRSADTTLNLEMDVFFSDTIIPPVTGAANDGAHKKIILEKGIGSIRLDENLEKSIFNTRTSKSADTLAFAFSVLNYYGNSVQSINPYVILHIKRAKGGAIVRDSIPPAFIFFSASENRAEIDERLESPYSSQNTLRTAVFKIDISKIIKAAGSHREVINATLFLEKSSENAGYRVVVLDELLSGRNSVQDSLLQGHFNRAAANNTLTSEGKAHIHSIKPAVRNAIDNSNSNIYVYLRSTSDHRVIMWDNTSLKVEAILTPSRLLR